MILLGIDGGQTSTKSIYYDDEQRICAIAGGPPIDHMLTPNGQMKSKLGIQQSLQALIDQVGAQRTIDMAFVSISGVHKEHEDMIVGWVREVLRVAHVLVEGDVKANLAGASAGRGDGVLIIAGGGSIGYGFDGGREYVSGGYGHILGDEGSAYWIGLQSLKAGIRHMEGRGPQTVLHERILHHFRETDYWGIKKRIHADRIERKDIARLAEIAEQAAGEGDGVAQSILREAGEELAQLAISVLKQMRRDSPASAIRTVYPTGGVFGSRHWVLGTLKETLRKYDSAVDVQQPQYAPIVGTLFLGAQAIGRSIDPTLLASLKQGGNA